MGTLREEISRGIYETAVKHPSFSVGSQFYKAALTYRDLLINGDVKGALKTFTLAFTRFDESGRSVRGEIVQAANREKKDIYLEMADMVYDFCVNKYIELSKDPRAFIPSSMVKFIHHYQSLNNGDSLDGIRDKIYNNPKILNSIINDDFYEALLDFSSKEYNKYSSIRFTNITDSGLKIISNLQGNTLVDSFNAVSKDGKVQVSSVMGGKKRQEDAVASLRKGDCMLNIVADGMGGTQYGPAASKMVIEDLTQWFNGLNLSKYAIDVDRTQMQQNSESLYKEIKEEILKIDKKLLDQYDGKAGTTVVLAFTTPGYTLFVNVGDSLAFVKTGNDYMQVTTLDAARGIPREIVEDYEAYRNFPYNHVVGNCLGMGIPGEVHHRFMDHSRPRRIVLTSDGVTDLVNEENFRNMVVGHATAKDITTKAAENPDKHVPNPLYDGVSHKMDDNISAIVIDIPENVKKGRTR